MIAKAPQTGDIHRHPPAETAKYIPQEQYTAGFAALSENARTSPELFAHGNDAIESALNARDTV